MTTRGPRKLNTGAPKNATPTALPPLFPLIVNGEEFTIRRTLGTEYLMWATRNQKAATVLTRVGGGATQDQVLAVLDVFCETPEITNRSVRMMLAGNHNAVDWAYDVSPAIVIRIAHEWARETAPLVGKTEAEIIALAKSIK